MNKKVFKTKKVASYAIATNTTNLAGGIAYDTGAEHSLAQYACTGTFNGTYYASAKEETSTLIELANNVSPLFLAQCAVYSRKFGYMKDMPAVLLAVLSSRDSELFKKAFPLVCDNGKMVKNFVQVMRSGITGRKSLGSAPKKAISAWLNNSTPDYLLKQSVGNDPSLADIIKMVHPSPSDKERENFYGYLIGKKLDSRKKLPALVKAFEKFKTATPGSREIPDLPFQLLASSNLTDEEWKTIAKNGAWQFTRMNLNNFAKHNLFHDPMLVVEIAQKLTNKAEIQKSKVFPYQLFQAFRNTTDLPRSITNALQDAMDTSVENIPKINTEIHIGVDSSGSMGSPVINSYSQSGARVTCNEVASLFASSIFRVNDLAHVYQFDTSCSEVTGLNPRDSVISNAGKINRNGGGTDCASFIAKLNQTSAKGDLVIMISDNESWAGGQYGYRTGTMTQWEAYKKRNPKAVLVCIDLTPGRTAQAVGKDILLVGGFSDTVFTVISKFYESKGDNTFWVQEIKKVVSL